MKYHLVVPDTLYTDEAARVVESLLTQSSPLPDADIIVIVGGDGELLKQVHAYAHWSKPFYGINAGTLGFLLNHHHNQPLDPVTIFNNLHRVDLPLLEVCVHNQCYYAFNEIMLGGTMNTWADFSISDNHELSGSVKAGGIILSTAQGSTGINKNNGGPILPLTSELWSLTADKAERKVKHVLTPRTIYISTKARTPITLWIDGSVKTVENVTNVQVKKSSKAISLLFKDQQQFLLKRRNSLKSL